MPKWRARLAALTLSLTASTAALSQGGAPAQAEDAKDIIIVTGTRIPRPDAMAASPVASFDRDELNTFRELNIEDFLNDLPQITPDFGRTSNNPGDGTASINLRGLGRSRTLVLLNGRRLAPAGTGSAIDVNTIPNALLRRVEIVSGGASAVYGSDAVTGAVNFITRDDLQGVEVASQFDIYGAGDGEAYNASVVAGTYFSDERGHISVYGDYLNRTPLLGGDREFTSVTITEDRNAGTLTEGGSFRIPEGIIFAPQAVLNGQLIFPVFNPDGSIRPAVDEDAFNFAPDNFLQTPLERWSGGAFINYELTPDIEIFTELIYARTQSDRQLASTTARFFGPLVIDSAFFADSTREVLRSTYDPDGDGIGNALIARRFNEAGPRRTAARKNYYRGVMGFRASPAPAWTIDGHYSYSRNDDVTFFENGISQSRFMQGLLVDPVTNQCVDPSGGCVPVNIFGLGNISTEALDFIRLSGFENRTRSAQHIASLIATGDLFDWRHGTVQISGGAEFRRNSAEFNPSPEFASGDALGFSGGFINAQGRAGAINVYETFAEILVPVLQDHAFAKRLELEAGGRFSHYSTSGGVWTWKAGGQWVPFEGLRLRGMWQRAVRAPNIEELLTNPSLANGLIDPATDFCLATNDPVGRGLADICIAQGMDAAQIGIYDAPLNIFLAATQIITGNPDLAPERAGTITAGAEYTFDAPFQLRVGVDYFAFKIEDAISFISEPLQTCAIVADAANPVCLAVRRDPTGFPIDFTQQPLNLAVARVKGIDANLEFKVSAPEWMAPEGGADLALRSLATYYLEFGQATTTSTPFVDCAGGFESLCSASVGLDIGAGTTFPDKLVTTTFSYDTSRAGVSLRWRWIGGIDNLAPVFNALAGQPAPNLPIPSVGSIHYLDASIRFDLSGAVRFRAGVDNLLATKPPLLGEEALQSNTDPSRYDIFGRRVFAGVEVRFGGP